MAERQHTYRIRLVWTGNLGDGTISYRGYARDHRIGAPGKREIEGSSDPAFRGDPTRWNPEELLLAALSACHQLWYLHLCAERGVVVRSYEDAACGTMAERADGSGAFTSVLLEPVVVIATGSDAALAEALHAEAAAACFIARSVNFPVQHRATISRE